MERCRAESPAFTRSAASDYGRKQCLCGDTNCHSKSITVPVTVVLGLDRRTRKFPGRSLEPAPDELFFVQIPEPGLRYMHFGKARNPFIPTVRVDLHPAYTPESGVSILLLSYNRLRTQTYYRLLFRAW